MGASSTPFATWGFTRIPALLIFPHGLQNARPRSKAEQGIASACGRILRSDAERDLYAWGLAVHTFVFDDTHSQLPIDEELLFRIFDIPPNTEEALWSLYQVGAAALDKMEYTPREGRNLALFTRLLMETLRIKDDFEELKTVHYDTEKGIINYG